MRIRALSIILYIYMTFEIFIFNKNGAPHSGQKVFVLESMGKIQLNH